MNPLKILHVTPNTDGYEVVTLLANRVTKKNHFAVIQKENGDVHYTGGFLINDTPEIRNILDTMEPKKVYDFVQSFKRDPFVKLYYENE